MDDILTQGNAIIESAGALNDGKRVFITLKMSDAIMAKRGDTINQYIVIANSHDGSLAITALVTNVRVVCNNTLTAAMQGAKDTIKVVEATGKGEYTIDKDNITVKADDNIITITTTVHHENRGNGDYYKYDLHKYKEFPL